MRIVDLLEMIQIDEQQRQRVVVLTVPAHLVLEVAEHEPAVVDAGELVFEYELRRILANVLEEVR